MLASAYRRLTYFKAPIDIKQLWHRRLRHASHTRIKHLIKLVDGIQLNYLYLLEDDNLSKDNQSDKTLCSFSIE